MSMVTKEINSYGLSSKAFSFPQALNPRTILCYNEVGRVKVSLKKEFSTRSHKTNKINCPQQNRNSRDKDSLTSIAKLLLLLTELRKMRWKQLNKP